MKRQLLSLAKHVQAQSVHVHTSLQHSSVENSATLRPLKPIMSVRQAEKWVSRLRPEEKAILKEALQRTEVPSFETVLSADLSKVTASDYWRVAVQNGLPFVGFGFLDNAIMIVAGEYIEFSIGVALGISTMAAAALGNAVSDVAGIGLSVYVEKLAAKFGVAKHNLTPVQLAAPSFQISANLGRAIGVLIGCIIGMAPLLFLPSKDEKTSEDKPSETEKKV